MKRRNFLKNIGKLSAAPLLLNGVGVQALANSSMFPMLTTCTGIEDRSVVVLFLKGGNDGLNTILPVDQYSTYIGHRPNIGLADTGANAYINLDNTLNIADQVGIHPSMTSFKDMYDSGNARLIQAVGYPSFNQSHFKSTDYWLTGKDGTQGGSTSSGWIGRFFENAYPGAHGNPSPEFPDPLGIQLGDTKASLSFHDCASVYEGVNLTNQNPANLFGLLNGLGTAPHTNVLASEYGDEIDYIMSVENNANVYGQRITNVYNAGTNSSANYSTSSLATQFKTVARLISGGSKTKSFLLHKGGFDTHANQVEMGDPHVGNHANLLTDVFDSIKSFHDDLNNQGLGHKVVTIVFSEFSRRITENGSVGTDHGNVAPMFVFGDHVSPGITGTNIDLTEINSSGNMNANQMQHDYRQVFKSVLQDWMGGGPTVMGAAELGSFGILPGLIVNPQTVDPSCYIGENSLPIELSFFEARLNEERHVELEWETLSEINHDFFEIQRMKDGQNVETIYEIDGHTNSLDRNFYSTIDPTPLEGISYYRLKSVDLDGKTEYSEWKAIELKDFKIENVKVYPNPAVFDFNLVLTTNKKRNAIMELFSINGQKVISKNLNIKEGFNKFSIDVSNIATGNYVVKVIGEGLDIKPMKVLVARK